jgi:PAS domain S-box-containing protein
MGDPHVTAASGPRLAALLCDHRAELLHAWTERVLADSSVPEARRLSQPDLDDHVPALLDSVIRDLDAAAAGSEASGRAIGASAAARQHARHRVARGYRLEEALRELSHFRSAILDLCAAHGLILENDAARLFDGAIDESMSTGAAEMERVTGETMRRQADLLAQSHDAILLWKLDSLGIISWNRGAEVLYGWTAAEAIGRVSHDLLKTEHPLGMPEIERILARAGRWDGELCHTARDGRKLVVDARLVVVEPAGEGTLVMETNRDVTERKQADEARREGEARLRAIVDTALDAIITIDEQGIIQSFNPSAERLFGYRAQEVVGHNVKMLMPDPYRAEHDDYLARYRRTGERRIIGIGREVSGRHKNGVVFPIDLAISETWLGARRIFTGMLRDITERKREREERERTLESERAARSEAERATRLRDEFVATVSHELRTPLNAILGWTSMLRSGKLDAAGTAKALEVVERNARAQADLVEDLLDVSRIGSGKLRLDVRPVDLAAVAENAVASHLPAAASKGVTIHRTLDSRACTINGDPGRLEQILSNLLSNAVKFTPRGGRVEVLVRRVGSRAELSVRDTGKGISAEFLPHVFDRFRQADAALTRHHRGLGLGLSLVKHLVEQHGGEVRVESEGDDRGATFTVNLPLAAVRRPQGEDPTPYEACASLEDVKLLVIDDEEDARTLIRRILEECGAKVAAVASAAEALEALGQFRPDVLISDIGMPDQDGYHLIRAVRALEPDQGGSTPAVAVTAFARSEDRLRALRAGFQMHLAKPIDPSELLVVVANLAGRPPAAPAAKACSDAPPSC